MNNKTFIIALIISLLFHYWIINIFSDLTDRWKYLEEKKEIILSARIEFLAPNSFSQAIEKNSAQYLIENSLSPEVISKEVREKVESQTEDIEEKKNHNHKQNLTESKEIANEQILPLPHKDRLKEQDNTQNVQKIKDIQGTNDSILTKNIDEKEKENYNEIIDQDSLLLKKEIEEKLVQEDSPLDLTNPHLIDNQITGPKIISYFSPEYPNNLRKRNIEGRVQLKVLISKEGKVMEVLIDTSSGYRGFDQAAVESVFQWKFKPARYSDEVKDSWILIPIVFKLK